MPSPKQPLDANLNPIPVLALKPSGAHTIAAASGVNRNAVAFPPTTKVVSVYATVPVFIQFGLSDVNASAASHYFPDGIYYDFALNAEAESVVTHLAVIRAGTTDGTVYVSEKI